MKSEERTNLKNGLTKEAQEEYLYIIKELLKKQYPNYSYALDYDVDNEKYVFVQKGNYIFIETGFYGSHANLYFGMKISVPYMIDSDMEVRFDDNWSYGIESGYNSYTWLVNLSVEHINVIEKFKEIINASLEIVEIFDMDS